MKKLNLLLTMLTVTLFGCTEEDLYSLLHRAAKHPTAVQHTELVPFQPAGDLGGPTNVLKPGTLFPPTEGSHATLRRGHDYIQFTLHTTGLPPGAYTAWYLIFNKPMACQGPNPVDGKCNGGGADLFLPTHATVWATGKVVKENGVANFSDKLYVGERRDEEPLFGDDLKAPLENPKGAEVQIVLLYHGPASDDPEVLYEQTHTLLGSCGPDEGANSLDGGPDFGNLIFCFSPQFATFPAP